MSRKRVEGSLYATATGVIRITDMDREQLLDLAEDLMAQLERAQAHAAELYALSESTPYGRAKIVQRPPSHYRKVTIPLGHSED